VIVIIAPVDDLHAIIAHHILSERFQVDSKIVDLALFPASAHLAISIGHGTVQDTRFRTSLIDFNWGDVDCVWWRRPKLASPHGMSTEDSRIVEFASRVGSSLIATVFNERDLRVINQPHRQDLSSCKGTQLIEARRLGILIPDTLVTNDPVEIEEFRSRHDTCVFKALTWMESRLIPTMALSDAVMECSDGLRSAPVIVQERLPPGLDVRVNIFGGSVYAAARAADSVDDRLDVRLWEEHQLPSALSRSLIALLRVLGLDYGCLDLRRLPDGRYVFLEVNPAGQFLMVERDTGQPLAESLFRLLIGDSEVVSAYS
jgi:glutathione synthase/RimK-type ligase-like ATP-grasp enzyme